MSCDRLSLAAVVLLLSASPATPAQDSPAKAEVTLRSESYTRVLDALTSGMSVEVTTNFTQCAAAGTGAGGPTITDGFHIRDFLVPENKYIAFSDVHGTLGPDKERVTEYIRYRVMPDGTVSIRSATRQTITGKPVQLVEYQCALDESVSFSLSRD